MFHLGDSGYPLQRILMKAIPNTREGTPQHRYSTTLTSARSSAECTIGLLKNRWRCLLRHRTLHYYPPKAANIISCCAALHNLCIRENVPLILENAEEHVNDVDMHENEMLEDAIAVDVRDTLINNYFVRNF